MAHAMVPLVHPMQNIHSWHKYSCKHITSPPRPCPLKGPPKGLVGRTRGSEPPPQWARMPTGPTYNTCIKTERPLRLDAHDMHDGIHRIVRLRNEATHKTKSHQHSITTASVAQEHQGAHKKPTSHPYVYCTYPVKHTRTNYFTLPAA